MQSFLQYLEEQGPYKYSSFQINMPAPVAATLRPFYWRIDPEDLHPDESVNEYHVTVLYGIHTEHYQDAMLALFNIRDRKPVTIELGDVSKFECPNYDVLKIDVKSDDLHHLNAALRTKLDYTTKYSDYHPHLTLAYLKPGRAQKYINKFGSFNGLTLTFETLEFSSVNGNRTEIHIGSAQVVGNPSELEIGSSSLTNIYRNCTPGQ